MDEPKKKPNLIQLLNHHQVTMIHLAQAAKMPLLVVHALAWQMPTTPETAERVLGGLEMLTGVRYALLHVNIPLVDPEATLPLPIVHIQTAPGVVP